MAVVGVCFAGVGSKEGLGVLFSFVGCLFVLVTLMVLRVPALMVGVVYCWMLCWILVFLLEEVKLGESYLISLACFLKVLARVLLVVSLKAFVLIVWKQDLGNMLKPFETMSSLMSASVWLA